MIPDSNILILDGNDVMATEFPEASLAFCADKVDYLGNRDCGYQAIIGSPPLYADDRKESQREELLFAIEVNEPDVFVLDLPRGFTGPRFMDWTMDFIDDLADARDGDDYVVGFTQTIMPTGKRRTLIVGRRHRVGGLNFIEFRAPTYRGLVEANLPKGAGVRA